MGRTLIKVEKRLDVVEQRLDGMDQRLDGMDKRLDGMDKRLDGMDKRLENVEVKVDCMELRLSRMDTRLGRVEVKVNKMDLKVKKMEGKVNKMDGTVGEMNTKITLYFTPRSVEQYARDIDKAISEVEVIPYGTRSETTLDEGHRVADRVSPMSPEVVRALQDKALLVLNTISDTALPPRIVETLPHGPDVIYCENDVHHTFTRLVEIPLGHVMEKMHERGMTLRHIQVSGPEALPRAVSRNSGPGALRRGERRLPEHTIPDRVVRIVEKRESKNHHSVVTIEIQSPNAVRDGDVRTVLPGEEVDVATVLLSTRTMSAVERIIFPPLMQLYTYCLQLGARFGLLSTIKCTVLFRLDWTDEHTLRAPQYHVIPTKPDDPKDTLLVQLAATLLHLEDLKPLHSKERARLARSIRFWAPPGSASDTASMVGDTSNESMGRQMGRALDSDEDTDFSEVGSAEQVDDAGSNSSAHANDSLGEEAHAIDEEDSEAGDLSNETGNISLDSDNR